jgi:hypothetical protein
MRYDLALYVRQFLVDEGASSMGKGGTSNAGRLAKRLREIPAQTLVAIRREI